MSTTHPLVRQIPRRLAGAARRAWRAGCPLRARMTGYWDRAVRRARRLWMVDHTEAWMRASRDRGFLIGWRQALSFQEWATGHPEWTRDLAAWAENVVDGQLLVRGQQVALDIDHLPWHGDWRGTRVRELSRLGFLLPVAQMAVIDLQRKWRSAVSRIAADWETANPVARSVNWTPAECAVRAIHLALAVQMMAVAPGMSGEYIAPLLRLLTTHGGYVYCHLGDARAAGSAHAVSLASLLVVGGSLQLVYPPARRWVRHAAARVDAEVERQFSHSVSEEERRETAEFLLLALIALEKLGFEVADDTRQRLAQVCGSIVSHAEDGDQQDGSALGVNFDPRPAADRCSLYPLAAAYFDDPDRAPPVGQPSSSVPWLLGGWQRPQREGDAQPTADQEDRVLA